MILKYLGHAFFTISLENGKVIACDPYGDFYDYKFSKEGEWTNPKEMVERNSDGYITKLGNRELTWDNKGYLTKRMDCSPYEDEPCSGIEYYYKDENVVDSLHEMQSGADAEIIHRYRCEDLDEYGNWTYSKVEVVDISRENMSLGEYTVIRKIKYWTEEDNDGKIIFIDKNIVIYEVISDNDKLDDIADL